jgi:PIN domain nuclease of toxin-antitoxin system
MSFPRAFGIGMGETEVILVDTHVLIWLAFDQWQLSKNAKAAINEARQNGEGLPISDITLLELVTLTSMGRIRLDISLESFLREIEARFIVLPISGCACVRALGLPAAYPKNPADRIIGANALVPPIQRWEGYFRRCDAEV